jgi:lysophospholipase L1-like esterase
MSQITNFSDLQTTSAITTGAQLLSRLANGLSGVDGFARINVLDFQKSLPLYSAYQSASGLAITNITVTAPLITTGGKTPALSISPATTGSAGSMSPDDKIKLISLPYTVGTGLSSIKPIFGNNTVTGNRSTVLCGFTNVVTGTDAIVAGSYNTVTSNYALVLGNTNYIDSGYAFGEFNNLSNGGLMAIGSSNTASNSIAMAIGIDNLADNPNAIAIGRANTVNADNAWAIGADITNSIYNSMIIGPDSNTNLIIRGDNGRIGLDTTAPISKLQLSNGTISIPSADISNNTTLTANSKYLQNYIGSGGNIVILPSCSIGNGLSFIVKNAGTGPVTVVGAGSDTIFASSAVTSITLNVGESGTFTIRSAAQWIVTVSTLSNTGVIAGTYGSSNTISTFNIDSKGRVLSAGNITLPANSSSATVLQTGRTIGMTGDVTWTTPTFNGSSNVTAVGTLSSTGVIAGTYGSSNTISTFNIDSKGRVLSAGSIPVSSAAILRTGRTIGMTGDVTWTTPTFDGSSNVTAVGTLSSTGVISGIYGSLSSIPTFNIDSKGRVLSAGSIPIFNVLAQTNSRLTNLESVNFALPPGPTTIPNLAFFAEADATLAMDGSAVTNWPDKSGNVRHATSYGISRSPILRTSGGPLGQAWLDFSTNGAGAQLGTPSWTRGTSSTVFVVAKIDTFTTSGDGILIAAEYNVSGILMGLWQNPTTYNGNLIAHNLGVVQVVGLRMLVGQWALYEMVFSPTVGALRINGDATWQATGSTGSGSASGLSIGNRGPASNSAWRGGIAAVAVFDGVVSDSNRAILRTYFSKKYLGQRQIIADGDSITEANPYIGDDWPTVATAAMTRPSYIINSGTGGQKLSTMITNAATQVDAAWNVNAVQKIVVLAGGYNDADQDAADANTIYNRIVTYCQARRAATPDAKVIASTLLPSSLIANYETTRTGVNTLLRANYTNFADGLADIGADPIMGLVTNTTPTSGTAWYSDGTHPTTAGRARIGAIFADTINSLVPTSDVAARTLSNRLDVEIATRLTTNSALSSLRPIPLIPSWDTADDSGTLIGSAFSTVWNVSGGTLRIKGSRPISEGNGEIFTFLNSSSLQIGPAIYDNAGVLAIRFRDASGNDIVAYNSAARSVPNFDLVINWSTSATTDRHAVWINGVSQVFTAETAGAFATTQNQLRWGASNLTIDHLAYYTSRSGTPVVLGSAASSPIITQNIVNFENSVQTLAAKLPRFRAAIAATNSGITSAHTHILCAGDSITWGYGSSKQSTIAPAKAYPRILLDSLPNSQQGIANPPISNLYFDNRWTAGTGWSINDNAWSTYQANSPAGYLTYTPDSGAFDRFDVFYLASPNAGLLRGTATGGTLTDIITDQPTNVKKATFSCGSVGYTNSISLSSIGAVAVIGIEPWLSTTPTVRVGNVGIFGSFASRWAGNAPWSGSTTWSCLRAIEAYAPHLFIISLGMNEAINSISLSAFETDMSTIISTVKVYADVMLVIPPIAGDGPTDARLATLALVYYRLAATYNLALLDLRIRFTSYSSTWMTDAYHPNDIGYSDIASGVSDILTSSVKIKSLSSTLPLYTIPTYANDNAADADIYLASGSQYKVTNARTVHIKP